MDTYMREVPKERIPDYGVPAVWVYCEPPEPLSILFHRRDGGVVALATLGNDPTQEVSADVALDLLAGRGQATIVRDVSASETEGVGWHYHPLQREIALEKLRKWLEQV